MDALRGDAPRKRPVWIWWAGGCGTLVLIALLCGAAGGLWVYFDEKRAAEETHEESSDPAMVDEPMP